MYGIEPTPLLIEHRRLLSSLTELEAKILADEADEDEAVDALTSELTDVADKVWSKPFPSDGDRREQYAALLERAEVAHFFNRGEDLEDLENYDTRAAAELISAVLEMFDQGTAKPAPTLP